jgi:hypothetical protein
MNINDASISMAHGILLGQIFVLLGGLFLFVIGGAIFHTLAFWRIRALRVDGETIGVRRRGPYFHGVYRYSLPSGETHEATAVQASVSPRGIVAGRHVAIQVMPDKPDEAREQHAPVLWALAIGSLLGGAWLVHFPLTAWKHHPVTWTVLLLATASVGSWIWQRLKALFTQMKPVKHPEPWSALPLESAESFAALPTASRLSTRSKARRPGMIFVIVGLAVITLAYLQAHELIELRGGVRTSGTVTDLVFSGNAKGDSNRYAVVQYAERDGTIVHFNDRKGENPSPYKSGDTVTILYEPGKPATATIDRGWRNWQPVVALISFGAVFTGVGLLTLRNR